MADMETVNVLVATGEIPEGTPADQLGELVAVKAVPAKFVVDDAISDVGDLGSELSTVSLTAGEQLTSARFADVEDLRAQGEFPIPDGAANLHQLTIDLPNPQALGGSIAPGDTVGLFSTFELSPPTGWVEGPDGELLWNPDAARTNDPNTSGSEDEKGSEDGGSSATNESITYTDLVLDKALVVRVEGGYIATTSEDEEDARAQDTIHVTLALEPQDAAMVIQSMQTGSVWLTLSPEGADEADIDAVIPAAPARVAGVVE
ncbi:hypothetical protein NF556_07535 [Ornithinimicrobium faecis]|uniref:Pilus assembly protein CpaB n=1 Tax=Ornithinimicrobium faecis TaxID=2934158 RepID=A0ABY4YZE5_9MICO|nr:hypothetical protein [Ornithinimicrobium sp. HY1793]USQ81492.1 hypothetical protein NF556_07535 [Ornithinimicrobium sp. HY1793]